MVISRGMSNGTRLPRINNPCELIMLRLEPEEPAPGASQAAAKA